MTRPEHRHKPPEPANEKMGMGHNRRLWVALSGRRHGTGRLRPGEPPAGTLTRARTAAPTPAAATASASDRAAGTRKIGRASSRARVCQYVSLPGAAGTL